jgi:hypothetical protein
MNVFSSENNLEKNIPEIFTKKEKERYKELSQAIKQWNRFRQRKISSQREKG